MARFFEMVLEAYNQEVKGQQEVERRVNQDAIEKICNRLARLWGETPVATRACGEARGNRFTLDSYTFALRGLGADQLCLVQECRGCHEELMSPVNTLANIGTQTRGPSAGLCGKCEAQRYDAQKAVEALTKARKEA
jgi:hypothetical protein